VFTVLCVPTDPHGDHDGHDATTHRENYVVGVVVVVAAFGAFFLNSTELRASWSWRRRTRLRRVTSCGSRRIVQLTY